MNSNLLTAMSNAGVEPSTSLIINNDGRIQRFRIANDKSGTLNGWIVCSISCFDNKVYCFGNWKQGGSHTYSEDGSTTIDSATRLQIESARREAERLRKEDQHKAALACFEQWDKAGLAKSYHPYLKSKGIQPHAIKVTDDNWLLIPVIGFDHQLTSLQYIDPNGRKSFRKNGKIAGCFCPIGNDNNADTILICEGFATGATLHEATGLPVIVAFNAGNLQPVSFSLRDKYPKAKLIVCADNDHQNKKMNVGLVKGQLASTQSKSLLIYPPFEPNDQGSDFNDLAMLHGLSSVASIVRGAQL